VPLLFGPSSRPNRRGRDGLARPRRFRGSTVVPFTPNVTPTLSDVQQSVFNTITTPKSTPTLTWSAGDVILVMATAGDGATTVDTPTATGLTFTLLTSGGLSGSQPWAAGWVATAATSGSGAISATRSGSTSWFWGIIAYAWSGSAGVGAYGIVSDTAKTQSLTRTAGLSAVVQTLGDYGAGDPTGHVWTPSGVVEDLVGFYTPNITYYIGHWLNQGSAGTTTYGYSGAGSSQVHTKMAVEILGSIAGTVTKTGSDAALATDTVTTGFYNGGYDNSYGDGLTASLSGVDTATAADTASDPAGAGTLTANAVQQATAAPVGAGTLTGLVVQRATVTIAGAGTLAANAQGTSNGTAAAAGAGVVTAAGTVILRAPAAATGAGVLAAAGAIAGTAAPTAAGSLTASAQVITRATATLAGAGALAASVGQTFVGAAVLAGAGAVDAAGRPKWVLRPNTGTTTRPNSGRTGRPVGVPAITYRP
jgi:hypothetical protein